MSAFLHGFDVVLGVARIAILVLALVAVAAALLDRAVRRRQVNPFGRAGRFSRRVIDPLLAPFEKRLLMSGKSTDSAGWWLVGAVVLGGLLLLALLGFVRNEVVRIAYATGAGPRGILILLLGWTFAVLKIALLVRVVSSWFRVNPFSRPMRVVYALTEWMLRPIRQLVPPVGGMIDLSPLIAYFLLWLLEGVVRGIVLGI